VGWRSRRSGTALAGARQSAPPWPSAALSTAKDSIGGALAVASQVAHDPAGGPLQAHALISAADHAFAHAVAHTSLTGGIILAVGTVLVALILPGRRPARSVPEPREASVAPDRATGSVPFASSGTVKEPRESPSHVTRIHQAMREV
jgi:hypothetical protein